MSAISHISVVSIPITDPDRSKAFYADVLGFAVLADNEFAPGQRWVQLAPPGAATSISLVTWFDDLAPGSARGNILEVADLAAARAGLEARGVAFPGEELRTPWGVFAEFSDPDGNRWSLHEPVAG